MWRRGEDRWCACVCACAAVVVVVVVVVVPVVPAVAVVVVVVMVVVVVVNRIHCWLSPRRRSRHAPARRRHLWRHR